MEILHEFNRASGVQGVELEEVVIPLPDSDAVKKAAGSGVLEAEMANGYSLTLLGRYLAGTADELEPGDDQPERAATADQFGGHSAPVIG